MRALLLAGMVACSSESTQPAKPTQQNQLASAAPHLVIGPAPPAASAPPPAPVAAPHERYTLGAQAELPDLEGVQEMVLQPDGKLLVVGEGGIARFGADLAIDETFGDAGVVRLTGGDGRPHRAMIDAQGRIVVAGYLTDKRAADLLVVRLLKSGKVDASFGANGRVVLDHTGTDDRPSAVFASGEDVVVIGIHQQGKDGPHYRQYLARFDALGAKKQVTFFDCIPQSREFVTRARADGDGWLLTGYAINPKVEDSGIFVARLRSDGSLDPAYGDRGVTWHRTRALGKAVAWVLTPLASGDVLVGGQGGPQDDVGMGRGYLARFNERGKVVTSWGDTGIAWAEPGSKWLSFVGPIGAELIAVERFKPGLLTIDAAGKASPTRTLDENGRYDDGAMLPNGDLVLAGRNLVRFERKR